MHNPQLRPIKLSVIGCGYLGAVHATCMAKLGHEVIGIDVDQAKVEALMAGRAPFYEPGLPELLDDGVASGALSFSTDISDAAASTVHFLAVGTPQLRGGHAADLSYLHAAVDALIPYLKPGDLVVGKSTVPVGTAAKLLKKITPTGAILVWSPEFLREGFAVQDTLYPDRIVYGLPAGPLGERARLILDQIFADALEREVPLVVTDYQTAELVKGAANAFLATKISFINAMAEIAETTAADVSQLADAIGMDSRIGRRFLNAGVGFGGGCLPKDIRAFVARAEELGRGDSVAFLKEVDAINLRRRERVVQLAIETLGGSVHHRRIAVLGLAFKPNSDDIRDSPALDVAVRLKGLGAQVRVTDPQAIDNAQKQHPQLEYFDSVERAVDEADLVILLTEWEEYRALDPELIAPLVNNPVIIDGRNALPRESWQRHGWKYLGLGRDNGAMTAESPVVTVAPFRPLRDAYIRA